MLFTVFILFTASYVAAGSDIDSLLQLLKQHSRFRYTLSDSNRVNLLLQLSRKYRNAADLDKAKTYGWDALKLSEDIQFEKGKTKALEHLGLAYVQLGNYTEALKQYYAALQVYERLNDHKSIATTHNVLAMIYQMQENTSEALNENRVALKLFEQLKDTLSMGHSHFNIGSLYSNNRQFDRALMEYQTALSYYTLAKDNVYIAVAFGTMGSVYSKMGNYTEALKSQQKSLSVERRRADKFAIAGSHNNIGLIYEKMGNYLEALDEYTEALHIYEAMNYKSGLAWSYVHLGSIKTALHQAEEGEEWMLKGVALFKQLGDKEGVKEGYEILDKAYASRGDYKRAYSYYRNYILYRDSLNNEETRKKSMRTQIQYEFDKKEVWMQAQSEAKIRRQKLIRNSVFAGLAVTLIFLAVVYRQRNKISKARKQSDDLLLNILPAEVADELKHKGQAEAKQMDSVTVLFTDFKGFTQLSELLSPKELVAEIDLCFRAFDHIMQQYDVEKIKTIGDAYMAAGGLPIPNKTHAHDVVKAAIDIQHFMEQHKKERVAQGKPFFEIRIGVHTGPVVAGIVGVKKFAYDIWGDTVNTASRMESSGEGGKVNISGTTYELIKSSFRCVHRGKVQAKGKGEIDMYFVEGVRL